MLHYMATPTVQRELPGQEVLVTLRTSIWLACMMVESLWATMMVVLSRHTSRSEDWMFRSVSVSSAEVASSRRIIMGAFNIVRAMHTYMEGNHGDETSLYSC